MEELTLDDVRRIFWAIYVAEGEEGDQWDELKAKLYRMYPQIRQEHEEKDKQGTKSERG